jgi:hypothetical protein
MKKIKAVVLKDATKLTNSQMKEIRGGVTVEGRPTKCSMQCDTGAFQPEIEYNCANPDFVITYGEPTHCVTSATIGIMCYTSDGVPHIMANCMYPRD